MDFQTKKSLGQNFIRDASYLDGVLNKLDLQPTDIVVEVGTGPGVLTKCLAKRVQKVITYEIDKRLEPILAEQFKGIDNIELNFQDALKSEFNAGGDFKVIANIPYYITTPLIMKFLNNPNCMEICVLIQKEVAERIVAWTSCAEYGALSVTCQIMADCHIVKHVPRTMFRPIPNVDSSFVVLEKSDVDMPAGFDEFIKRVFSQRRKKISNSIPKEILAVCDIDPDLRPENINPDDFYKIFQEITKTKQKI